MKKLFLSIALIAMTIATSAAVQITQAEGWLETAWAEFTMPGYDSCAVYVQPTGDAPIAIDKELIRRYSDHWRVDALGLPAGNYTLKVVPYNAQGQAVTADEATTTSLQVRAHDRNGFAHLRRPNQSVGVGAYNDNGTLKSGARVLYVTAANCNSVQLSMRVDTKGTEQVRTGLQRILSAYEKGAETRPLAIRIIGCIPVEALDSIGSTEEGLQIKGHGAYQPLYLTIEGVGNDAAISGFGILNRGVSYVEFRNFGVLNCMDDCLGFNTKNSFGWVHHMDFFYGKPGGDADQAKGDGTVDIKDLSTNITVSYNHFFDSGKSSLCGMKIESDTCYITYHHNWFDHSDSRHPRIRTMSVHIYNNYYDGNAKYGVGMTSGGSAFVENNYFLNCKNPMMTAGQGTDALGDGTFSGEAGGVIKAYGNYMSGQKNYHPYSTAGASCDAYDVTSRSAQVPATVTAVRSTNKDGEVFNNTYNNFDQAILSAITPDATAQVPAIVTGAYGAGRCQKGNISFTFANSENTNYAVIPALQTTVVNYPSSAEATALESVLGLGEVTFVAPEDTTTASGGWELYWDNTQGKWSTTQFTVTGNTTKKTQTITLLDGSEVEVAYGLKMESATSVSFIAPSACTLKIIFQNDQTGNIKVDGSKQTSTTNVLTLPIAAGEHEITKGDSRNVFYIGLDGVTTGVESAEGKVHSAKYMLNGQIVILRDGVLYDLTGRRL